MHCLRATAQQYAQTEHLLCQRKLGVLMNDHFSTGVRAGFCLSTATSHVCVHMLQAFRHCAALKTCVITQQATYMPNVSDANIKGMHHAVQCLQVLAVLMTLSIISSAIHVAVALLDGPREAYTPAIPVLLDRPQA